MTLLEFLVKELPGRGGWPDSESDFYNLPPYVAFYFHPTAIFPCLKVLFPKAKSDTEEVKREQYESAIAAQKPAWNGEGFPPVGVECELAQPGQINWRKFKVVAVESGAVFGFWGNGTSSALDGDKWLFRPIRTEAERKREDAQCAIGQIMINNRGIGVELFIAGEIYSAIAAGKIPGVEIKK